ncbi:MAG TPA: xanthine dehydrogenase family protein molybdopterin-binding subunit [Candidatus Limnocylindrales bacterium]|jgi:CO/xanthine dehydrogenase Mo-binding subunit|nr:xanthine dehydrogenase family protein molybdopterin-binding subunit [Candidatus Limnocylindrales bacterium]
MAVETGSKQLVGVSRPRVDSATKVTGATRFAADLPVPGLLYARVVPSLYAHARIRSVDASAALAVPGVVAVLTASDLPIVDRDDMRMFEPLARAEAIFAGQPVALVVAETEEAADDAAELVVVDVEQLAPVVDLEAAMRPESPLARLTKLVEDPDEEAGADAKAAHAAVGSAGAELEDEDLSPNVVNRKRYVRGDAAAVLASSDVTVAARFRTNWVYQAYLEPHAATAWLEPDGTLALASSTQGTFYVRKQLARMYGRPLSKVRVTGTPLGGAFGSKVVVVDPLVAGAALRLGRPVRLVFTRREDMAATNPASGSVAEVRIGARRDGTLSGLDARLVFDAGAYTEWSIEGIAAILVAGPYRWEAFDVRAYGVRTNRFGTGSYRGPGGPQAAFAIESLLDELATRLGMDPIELRLRNLVGEGDEMVDGASWPGLGHREVLQALAAHRLWTGRSSSPDGEGIGVALGVWPGGKEPAAAICRLNGDGTITVATGVVDMSGTDSAFAIIAAEAFGVPVDQVDVVSLDTAGAPVSPMSGGSVVTYAAGRAVREAALDARRQLLEYAATEFEIDPSDLELVDGVIRPVGSPDRGRPVAAFAEELADFGSSHPPVEGHRSTVHKSLAPSCAGHLVRVRIDRETGRVDVLDHVVAQDVGRALNPALVEGQMRGGAAQGLGWALYEALVHDANGQLLTGSFLDYAVPRSGHVPKTETIIVEVPAPDGPFGAKGIGEAPVIAAAPAVASAIAAAGGPRIRELPMTPVRVWQALRDDQDAR